MTGLSFLGNMLGSNSHQLLGSIGEGLAGAAQTWPAMGFKQQGLGIQQQQANTSSAAQLQLVWNNLNGKLAKLPIGSPERAAMEKQADVIRERIMHLNGAGGAGGATASPVVQSATDILRAPAPAITPAGAPTTAAPATSPSAPPPGAPAGTPHNTAQEPVHSWWDPKKEKTWLTTAVNAADYEANIPETSRPSYLRAQRDAAAGRDDASYRDYTTQLERAEEAIKSGTYIGSDNKSHEIPGFAANDKRLANIEDNKKYLPLETQNQRALQQQEQNFQKLTGLFEQFQSGAFGGDINEALKAVKKVAPNLVPDNYDPAQADAIMKSIMDVTANTMTQMGGGPSDARFAGAQHAQPSLTNDPHANRSVLAQRLVAIDQQKRMHNDYLTELRQHFDLDRATFQNEWLRAHPMEPEVENRMKDIAVRGDTPMTTIPGTDGRGSYNVPDTRKLVPGTKYVIEPIPGLKDSKGNEVFANGKPRTARFIGFDKGAPQWKYE